MNGARFEGIIFDMDGTLTVPVLDFAAMRRELGLPSGDLAHEINRLPAIRQRDAWAVVDRHEAAALDNLRLQEGAADLLHRCAAAGLRLGLLTRNQRSSVEHMCRVHALTFDAVVTREFAEIKPHPAPAQHILRQWSLDPHTVLMVGDYVHDIECGRRAGTRTCFFQNPGATFHGEGADHVVASMRELGLVIFGESP
jgi:HAD superfamily hydrolase (TIGR01549 family)